MKLVRLSLLCLLSAVVVSSCVKKHFDSPPDTTGYDPMLHVNATIESFAKAGLNLQIGQSRVLGDTTIYGIVIGDDRSGNIYKKIIIEDTAGWGMMIVLDKTNLYGDYPVGRRVYIKTNGLYLTNYKGLPEIVYSVNPDNTTNGIPSSLISTFVIKGSYPHFIKPAEVTGDDLLAAPFQYLNTLVKISGMQFDVTSANVPYSNATASTNRAIVNCTHTATLVMYNSNYANFQSAITPNGNGFITGIMSIYISTPQFTLRDTSDVSFTGPRCP